MLSSTPVYLKIGRHLLDVLHPRTELIDLDAIEDALWSTHRFSGNPRALTVRQHTGLVKALALRYDENHTIQRWCWHHDDHEAVIGDIPGPLKRYLNLGLIQGMTTTLDDIESRLDICISEARGFEPPTRDIYEAVHFYDKLAETLEWLFVLNEERTPWNVDYRRYLTDAEAATLVGNASNARRD